MRNMLRVANFRDRLMGRWICVLYHYFEYAAVAAFVLALIFLGVSHFRKEKAPACDINVRASHTSIL